jgi:hypothetical protein
MKKQIIVTAIASIFFAACRGDHPASSGRDTAELKVAPPKSLDTTKITSGDHSADGGTKAAADTARVTAKKP